MSQKILLVEDNFLVRKSMRDVIEILLTCEVFESENGKIALEMIQGGFRPNIIISDVEMPIMDGLEFLSEIKQKRGIDIPIIIMSGNGNFQNQAIKDGATAFLIKPLDMDALLAMIEKYARP